MNEALIIPDEKNVIAEKPGKIIADDLFITKCWDEQVLAFEKNLQVILQWPTRRSVHDIRVAVKKLRSYLKLRGELTGEKWNEEFSAIKILFKTLGRQRDIEMSLSVLSAYHRREKTFLQHFKKFLQTNGRLSRRWSRQAASDLDMGSLQALTNRFRGSFTSLSDEQVVAKITALSAATLKKVRKLSSNFKKNIHPIRKLLKDLFYWLKACPENPVAHLVKIKSLEKILTDLGRWQDHFIFLNKLKGFRKNISVKGSEEFSALHACEEKIKKLQDELLNKIKMRGAVLFLK